MRPEIVGDEHCGPDAEPFEVGDLDPSGPYVHVMDDATLDILLSELDTVVDFADYLSRKASFVRSGQLRSAAGEQDLLAHYATRVNDDGHHDFVEAGRATRARLDLEPGRYEDFVNHPQYLARRQADEISYAWDRLIECFTDPMIEGTTVVLDGHDDFDLRAHELGVRYMALQRRTTRRLLGGAVVEALQCGATADRFFRAMVMPPGLPECETGFFLLTMKYVDWMVNRGGYGKYRRVRVGLALAYAKGLLVRMPHLERVIGIVCEPPEGEGGSEDLVYVEQSQWSEEDRALIEEDCMRLGLFREGTGSHRQEEEFPAVPVFEDGTDRGRRTRVGVG